MNKKKLSFILNGLPVTVETDPTQRLLDVIRDILKKKGTKEGCGVGECGACTVIMNGIAVNSCLVMAGQAEGAEIVTIEGLSEKKLADVIKTCFVEEGAVQCGFCTPGMILSAYVLLKQNPSPSIDEIREGLSGNLCRCTGYVPIVNAVKRAALELQSEEEC